MSAIAWLDKVLNGLLSLLMMAMVVVVTWQVLSRYLLGHPSQWTEEVARFLLIWIGLLGGALAYRVRMHLGLDLLGPRLSEQNARRLRSFCDLVVIGFAVTVLVFGGASLMQLAWQLQQTSAALGIYMAWVYAVIPVSGVFIVLYGVLFLLGMGETEDGTVKEADTNVATEEIKR